MCSYRSFGSAALVPVGRVNLTISCAAKFFSTRSTLTEPGWLISQYSPSQRAISSCVSVPPPNALPRPGSAQLEITCLYSSSPFLITTMRPTSFRDCVNWSAPVSNLKKASASLAGRGCSNRTLRGVASNERCCSTEPSRSAWQAMVKTIDAPIQNGKTSHTIAFRNIVVPKFSST